MTKVTLLGDSIRLIGYGPVVAEKLKNDFEVWQPEDNGRFVQYTLRGMYNWAGSMQGTKIVHWNCGLWDICELFDDGPFTPLEDYIDQMLRVADILIKRYGTVIFATTTPVTAANRYNRNEVIRQYNDAIVPKLKEKGVIINDLYSLVAADIDRYICEDTIHLSEEGVALCAEAVEKAIRAAAQALPTEDSAFAAESDTTGAPV